MAPTTSSMPGMAREARKATSPAPSNGVAHGQPHRDRAGRADARCGADGPAQLGRGAGVDGRGSVSLNWRMLAKPGGEGDVGEGQVGGLDEQPGGLGALGPGQRDRTGSDLVGQLAVDVPLAVAEAIGQARRRPRGRRRRRRSGAWPGRPGRPAGPTRASPAWRRAGIAGRPGTRPTGPRPTSGRTRRWPASGSPPGSSAGSRCRWRSPRRRSTPSKRASRLRDGSVAPVGVIDHRTIVARSAPPWLAEIGRHDPGPPRAPYLSLQRRRWRRGRDRLRVVTRACASI